jgi:phospholipid/cholesterol/gamma-HCH transport system substrate-binding protein
MIKNSREIKTGAVVILVTALFIWGFNYLKGHNILDGASNTYFIKYANVQGLSTASAVTVNGFDVGKVVAISFDQDPDKKGELIVQFSVEKTFPFGKNSIAKIYSASLMGGKSLAIIPSYDSEQAESGDFLAGEIESDIFSSVGEKLNPLQAKLENVISSADSLLVSINDILDKQSRNHIKESLAKMNATMSNLERLTLNAELLVIENREGLKKSIGNVKHMSENFAKISDTLVNANLGLMLAKIDTTVANIESITASIDNGKGTLGKLVNDDALYLNLDKATLELGELLEDFKLHPKRYVNVSIFGKKEKPYEAKEVVKEEEKK